MTRNRQSVDRLGQAGPTPGSSSRARRAARRAPLGLRRRAFRLREQQEQGGYFGDQSVSNDAVAGVGSITAGPFSNTTFVAQISRGFRDPTLSDRFFRGPSGRGFITGNPELEPETSLQLDLGARYSTRAVPRRRLLLPLPHQEPGRALSDDADRFVRVPQPRPRRDSGLRGGSAGQPRRRLLARSSPAQIGRGDALDDNANLDDISPDTSRSGSARRSRSKFIAFGRIAVYADDGRPGPSEIDAPGHTNLDLGASWTPQSPDRDPRSAPNLLNQDYYASPDPRFVAAPGINGSMTVAIKYREVRYVVRGTSLRTPTDSEDGADTVVVPVPVLVAYPCSSYNPPVQSNYLIREYPLQQGALEIAYIEEFFSEFPERKTAAEIIQRLAGARVPDPHGRSAAAGRRVGGRAGRRTRCRTSCASRRPIRSWSIWSTGCATSSSSRAGKILYNWLGATRLDWRGQGHFRALTEEQEVWAVAAGLRRGHRQDEEPLLRHARHARQPAVQRHQARAARPIRWSPRCT